MTDINTPEGRKALRDAYERWADYGGDFTDVDDLAISVPALLDALDEAEADRDELKALDAEAQIGADEQTKQLRQLEAENARLTAALEKSERELDAIASPNDRTVYAENARLRERLERMEESERAADAEITRLRERAEHLESEISRLADYILREVPGEPSQSQGACDTAIRVMTALRERLEPTK